MSSKIQLTVCMSKIVLVPFILAFGRPIKQEKNIKQIAKKTVTKSTPLAAIPRATRKSSSSEKGEGNKKVFYFNQLLL
jgi:putative cell wall-binding protein